MWFRRNRGKTEDAEKALADAEKNLLKVQQRGPEVDSISKALKDMRERNHFAEALENVIRKSREA